MAGFLTNLLAQYAQFNLQPLWNNIGCALITVIYVKTVLEIAAFIRDRLKSAFVSRKFLHVFASCWILFWPLFDVSHWSWRLNILVPSVMSIKIFYKGAILADPNDIDVRTMSRSSSPGELLFGPLQFTCFMMWVGIEFFMTAEGAILVAALGIGDGIAPIIGLYYGNLKYRFPLSSRKSIEGSFFGVFLGTIAGCYCFINTLGLPPMSNRSMIICAIISTVAEATAPANWDNIVIPLVMHFTLKHNPSLMT